MDQKEFRLLLNKYKSGKATARDAQQLEQWYELLEIGEVLNHEEELQSGERMLAQVNAHTGHLQQKVIPFWRSRKTVGRIAAAAMILIFSSLGFWFYSQNSVSGLMAYQNERKTDVKIHLEDGSTIVLGPGSGIRYPKQFDEDIREVYLEGKGFFSVHHETARPFLVYAGQTVTKVLGTSFTVDLSEDQHVAVEVKTGKVSVSRKEQTGKPQAVLTPNQKMTFSPENQKFETDLVENPVSNNAETNGLFVFKETPLKIVLARLQQTYGIEIDLPNPALNDCQFSGDISGQPFFTKLKMISNAMGGTYTVNQTRVRLEAPDCKQL